MLYVRSSAINPRVYGHHQDHSNSKMTAIQTQGRKISFTLERLMHRIYQLGMSIADKGTTSSSSLMAHELSSLHNVQHHS
ncbi:hypothetical protein chiPu_0000851 [Chiloscyllium punctatum]|uniref:Uncharacterized protein n=1 Tax=Chiloscyllium punctatum TaxID=137246 RepID=A0A401RWF5_CHIPU|nr:hypothetical protein [Chiloscyllium punctatum]